MRQRLLFAIFLLALVGCGDPRTFTEADSWYSPPEAGLVEFTAISRDEFAVVGDEHQPEAQAMLADIPAKSLTEDEAKRLLGKPLAGDGQYVLLRSVVLSERTGAHSVSRSGSWVQVSHVCLGRGPVPMRRKAIVARLPEVPKTVCVTCSMAV